MSPYPDRDLGLIIMSDDDGLITDLYTRSSGPSIGATSIGQTFIARGVNLISAAVWIADPGPPIYMFKLREDGPNGAQIGPTKKGKPARVGADPEVTVLWAPGECPLTPGRTYYLEVMRETPGAFINVAYANNTNPFPYGQAHKNGVPISGTDLAGTIMEEASPGMAVMPRVRITSGPAIAEADRGTNQLTIRWTTDVPSDSSIEVAPINPPYTSAVTDTNLVTDHVLTLTGLRAHTLYHFRVSSAAPGFKRVSSRDIVIATQPRSPNLLANPGFEEGTGASPRRTIPAWSKSGGLDMAAADGRWFSELKPRSGNWLFQGAANASASDAYLYQRVAVTPSKDYTFSVWALTKPLERINNQTVVKYDVWNNRNRLIYMRLGIDPTGGVSPTSSSVQWTPRFYSHLRYSNVAKTAKAQSGYLTLFLHMKGDGVEWHLYGVDDCLLTEAERGPVSLSAPQREGDGAFAFTLTSDPGSTNRIEASTNLLDWEALAAVLNTNGILRFLDQGARDLQQRFYRAR
jgi:hypothetical protein